MAPSLLDLSQRILAWMVALLAGLGALGNVLAAALYGHKDLVVVWLLIMVLSVAVAAQVESLKRFLEAWKR